MGEKIDSSHVVPVCVTDDHISDVLGSHSRQAHGLIGSQVILDRPFLEPALPMKAAVEENIPPAATDQPKGVDGVDFLILGRADDEFREPITRTRSHSRASCLTAI